MMAAILRFIGAREMDFQTARIRNSDNQFISVSIGGLPYHVAAPGGGIRLHFPLPSADLSAIPDTSLSLGECDATPARLLSDRGGRLLSLQRRRRLGDREPHRALGADV